MVSRNKKWIAVTNTLQCAQLFEWNVSGEDFKNLYVKHGGDSDIGSHLGRRFAEKGLLHTVAKSDLKAGRIIGKMVTDWCSRSEKESEFIGNTSGTGIPFGKGRSAVDARKRLRVRHPDRGCSGMKR